MIGRCRHFFEGRGFGFLEYSKDGEAFDESVFYDTSTFRPGDYVEFELECDWNGRPRAKHLRSVEDVVPSTVVRVWRGIVTEIRKKSARIEYVDESAQTRRIWASLDEMAPWNDGVVYAPAVGCEVEFHISQVRGREVAAVGVSITQWPEMTIEEHFLNAEELPLDAPVGDSIFSLLNRKKTLLQLVQETKQ